MVYSLQRAVVGDYEEWKTIVEELADRRAESGSQGGQLFKSPANPNEIVVLFEWESEEKAREFMEEVIPAKQWDRARIHSYEIHFLEHVEDLDA
ncbi:antibiotic biosynthesis monooxygenase [Natronococcus wangiae]|uniref:antibiotic biosynthesis monooxygenase n=1 Tax=Natronococcus wangiae TaxID=3068275 RepID=UPI00273F6AB8|nr:antibiotic biosynthesis monooxygenase [Natronococcus sp. AD5]